MEILKIYNEFIEMIPTGEGVYCEFKTHKHTGLIYNAVVHEFATNKEKSYKSEQMLHKMLRNLTFLYTVGDFYICEHIDLKVVVISKNLIDAKI